MTQSTSEARLEARLAQAEAQIETLQERIAELTDAYRQMKQGALWTRVFLLLAGLGAFFFIRFFSGG